MSEKTWAHGSEVVNGSASCAVRRTLVVRGAVLRARAPLSLTLLFAALAAVSSAAAAEPPAGPKDQFQSVVYVRKAGAAAEMFKSLHPDTITMIYPEDFYAWGGKYMYLWFWPCHVLMDEKPATYDASDAKDPHALVGQFTKGMWNDWDKLRAAGIVTGERPPKFEDLCIVTEKEALAQRDGLPPDTKQNPSQKMLRIANPDVTRLMCDIEKFNAAHLYNNKLRKDPYMPVNGGFVDLYGPVEMDYSEHARAKFDSWLRGNHTPQQIQALLQADPAKPIPLLTPRGASAEVTAIYSRLRMEFYFNTLLPQHGRALKEAIDSVLGPGQYHYCYHGDGHGARVMGAYPTNMVYWGDWLDSYLVEMFAFTPYVQGGRNYYAVPHFIEPRGPNHVAGNWRHNNNVYDYQYGAGRLWGEPVVLKTGYKGQPVGRSAAVVQLALAEGLALLGNMRIDAASETSKPDKGNVRGSLALPMVEFMHSITPQVRQMIPAARIGVLFSPADSWMFRGFDKPSNDTQAYQVSNILQAQHVPLQVVHLQILAQTLAQRPMDALIVPWMRLPKDEHAAELERFVREGGKVVFVGECGTLTWDGLRREKNAFAGLLPAPRDRGSAPLDGDDVAYRQVGKGRTAFIPGALDEKPESAQKLQTALLELLGHVASCVQPDQFPLLLTNLARNSDNSRFWMHLVNYDVDYFKSDAEKPICPVENVRVVVPLPEGLCAKSVKLYRPGQAQTTLTMEAGSEGCAVTVPRLDIYALIAVETEPGQRPEAKLLAPATAAELAAMVAREFDAPPLQQTLVAPPGPLPPAEKGPPRRLTSWLGDPFVAYATSSGGQPVQVQYKMEDIAEGGNTFTIYSSDGKKVAPKVVSSKESTVLTLPGLPEGAHYSFFVTPSHRHQSFAFTHEGGASFEASQLMPFTLDEPGDSAPLYFYVPKACKSFKLYPNTRPFWTSSLQPVHLVVKDSAGATRLDQSGPIDGGWTWERGEKKDKVLEMQVPAGQAGRVWSLWLLNAPPTAEKEKKGFVQFWLDGVPPVVASSPSQLLIIKGQESAAR